jgi:hypothetical protein
MRKNQRIPGSEILVAALLISFFFVGTSLGQVNIPSFTGSFTLASQVHWDRSVLQPGQYTITVGSPGPPMIALIRDQKGRSVALVATKVRSTNANVETNELLMAEKDGQLCVHSVVLAGIKTTLIYDPALARKAVLESQVNQTIPVMWAKK